MRSIQLIFKQVDRALILVVIFVFVGSTVSAFLNIGNASAASVTSRSVTLGSGVVSAVTTYSFSFVPVTTAAIQGLKFQACTTALGTCTAPAGLSFTAGVYSALTGTWTNATAFTFDATGATDCIASASVLCAKRTQAANETGVAARGLTFTTITNPNGTSCATVNCTFFIRMTTYSVNTYTVVGIVDTGTMASSTIQSLTVNATIQETLSFCIGATTINDGVTAPAACASISGTSLNLGTLNSGNTSVSPVPSATYNGDANNGIAEISTNANNGVAVQYDAIQQSGTNHNGTLKVSGATCNVGVVNTDQCINAIGTTEAHIVTGTENFGMTVAAVNCAATTGYTCTFAGGTYKMTRDVNYNGTGANTYPTDTGVITGTTNAFYAWDETGTFDTIASSTSPVDREALILKFAATPNLVTPTGSYTAKADFVATPSF